MRIALEVWSGQLETLSTERRVDGAQRALRARLTKDVDVACKAQVADAVLKGMQLHH